MSAVPLGGADAYNRAMFPLRETYRTSLALLTDLYQLTMAQGYWKLGRADQQAVFHLSFRRPPFDGGYTVAAGLEAALDQLAEAGWRFAVCTNKLEGLSVRLLDALGLTARFDAICGQDTFGVQKPHPDILLRTIERAGGAPDRAVMIGDSATDINVARAAAVPVIAVDFGYTEIPVAQLAPDRIIDHYSRLPSTVFELTGAWT